uniref:Peptide transport system permease protein sapC (TC 3.A.1.5.5) n=1 Tax=Rheinheimera sp. BAL341 TaxID=1708203 RepID=A0A486XL14_9GAMM
MAQLVAINPQLHQHLRLQPANAGRHSEDTQLMPVVPAEFASMATQAPIVLTKNGQTGQFVAVALLGFAPGENLFYSDNAWQGDYLPLQLQRQPFFLGQAEAAETPTNTSTAPNNKEDYVLCIDSDSPTICQPTSIDDTRYAQLFTETGADSRYFQQAKSCLAELLRGEQQQQQLVQALLSYDLIQPLSLDIVFDNEQSTRLNGLYTIDQQKLAALAPDKLVELHQAGWLLPIYTLIASTAQIYPLIARKNRRLAKC